MTTNTTPTHDDWEAARQKRNEAAARFIWTAHGTVPNAQAPDPNNQFSQKWLGEFYRWDAEMDRIQKILDEKQAELDAQAEAIARATGSRGSTYTEIRPDGSSTSGSWGQA